MRNLRLQVEYDGTAFHGFARQEGVRTVQGVLETVLQATLGEPVELIGASRTDAGVHARGQVVNFFTSRPVPVERLTDILNRRLPMDLKVLKAQEVSAQFHARLSAKSRVYRYRIYTGAHPSVWKIRYAWHYPRALNPEAMQAALETILGEHDFRPFSVKIPTEKNTVRTLYRGVVQPTRDGVYVELEANGFLRGMVRLIVGELARVSEGKQGIESLRERLENRVQATHMAPAAGLCLMKVKYKR
ncbi:MAG: tRNA pseudouridine synthase A [Fimbriimonadales bacterium]|nr:MAG: tRNA pseudouridine synthase A [Fimbriimonadales bacterium]GIV07663.1 MAG: tRNA pseudouridine synthase A [Fimbriimonadales bacterium]GIV10437.1 MAG: tRNA pseudouridine synthase A [Fimbriimonadales bacterium]